ncbi:uncharacterized protein LOC130747613 [Lotus japonicus]|uniref:uncharacterized protein LOC130747613 n=1 Tax=Lotus japonicus TaxID=34305 RepID=UPI002589238E|nr:uncharacterized protein LOC130747613 [Lotus japonicus]
MSPFAALYGRHPPALLDYVPDSTHIEPLDSSLQQRNHILRILKANLVRAQQRMKDQKDKSRVDITFAPEEWVLLRLQPYRQQTVHRRTSQKLARRFYGPFRIKRRLGVVAYELNLPTGSKIHPIFHVSLLERFHGDPSTSFVPLPPLPSDLPESGSTKSILPLEPAAAASQPPHVDNKGNHEIEGTSRGETAPAALSKEGDKEQVLSDQHVCQDVLNLTLSKASDHTKLSANEIETPDPTSETTVVPLSKVPKSTQLKGNLESPTLTSPTAPTNGSPNPNSTEVIPSGSDPVPEPDLVDKVVLHGVGNGSVGPDPRTPARPKRAVRKPAWMKGFIQTKRSRKSSKKNQSG